MESLPVIARDCALKLEAIRDFTQDGKKVVAGDEWLEYGPKIYIPRIEVRIIENVEPIVITSSQALRVRAIRATKDSQGKERSAGEEWLIRAPGFYIPGADEAVDQLIDGQIITDRKALLLRAKQTF